MTSQNRLTTVTTLSHNFANIQLQRKPQQVDRASFITTIHCKRHFDHRPQTTFLKRRSTLEPKRTVICIQGGRPHVLKISKNSRPSNSPASPPLRSLQQQLLISVRIINAQPNQPAERLEYDK
eukprot:scaffold18038_cov59-Cyclotella_meneghiniana.AAC.5